jgi:hypothetical protein
MYQIKMVLEGLTPILFNSPTPQALQALKEGTSGGTQTDEQRRAEAHFKVYKDERGVFWPWWNFKVTFVAACRKGRLKMAKQGALGDYVDSFCFPFEDGQPPADLEKLHFSDKPEFDFMHECFGKIPPRVGKGAIIYRPALDTGWLLPIHMAVLNDGIQPNQLQTAMILAGSMICFGGWRRRYGRFRVKTWEVIGWDKDRAKVAAQEEEETED